MNILITGGTGFLGSALKDHLLKNSNHKITIFARNEAKLSLIVESSRLSKVCGDIRDYDSLYFALEEQKIDLIIHTAALKRIDTCQENPIQAYKTNVDGTWNCIKCCKKLAVSLAFISTDKACEPCTTYGATKYLAEQLVRRESQRYDFKGYVIRYGNVLNSTGSVLKIWKDQFDKEGRVEVRDVTMTRFFWSVEESVIYIQKCIESDKFNKGTVYIPELKALNIYDMACYLYGKENVVITHSSHTEKIHESLSGDYCSKDHVVKPELLLCKPS